MRRFLLILSLFGLLVNNLQAGEATTDHFTVSDLMLVPGGTDTYKFTLSLVGSRIYTAFNLDIHFPSGLDVEYRNNSPRVVMYKTDGTVFPYDEDEDSGEKTWFHQVSSSYGAVGQGILRIACNSNSNAEFTATSGKLLTIYVKASPYLKPGTVEFTIDGIALTVKQDSKQYDPADETYSFTVSDQSTLTLNISSANQWSTCVLPFALNPLPDGVQAYSCGSTDGDYLTLTEETSMQAYTPYILFAENGYSQSHTGTVPAEGYAAVVSAGYLRGAVAQQSITEGYVLQNLDDGVKFYACGGQTFVIPEGRCWLDLSGLNARNAYGLQSPGAAAITATTVQKANPQPVYDLSGRRVATPQPGHIYVVEGRKALKIK